MVTFYIIYGIILAPFILMAFVGFLVSKDVPSWLKWAVVIGLSMYVGSWVFGALCEHLADAPIFVHVFMGVILASFFIRR